MSILGKRDQVETYSNPDFAFPSKPGFDAILRTVMLFP